MNIIEMQAYQCGKCKKAYGDKEVAEKCCEPTYCPKCGIEKPSYYVHCEKCRLENQYNSGNKIPYLKYKIDKMYDERRNKYYSDYEEMFEDYSENILSDEDDFTELTEEQLKSMMPKWLFGCEEVKFKVNIDPAIENAEEKMYEEFDDIVDREELEQFVAKWNEKQNGVSYYPDYKTIIVF